VVDKEIPNHWEAKVLREDVVLGEFSRTLTDVKFVTMNGGNSPHSPVLAGDPKPVTVLVGDLKPCRPEILRNDPSELKIGVWSS
jgi:hypothetical protein